MTVSPSRILLIEDETAIAEPLLYVLRADGLQVQHVTLGLAGLDAHRQQAFDLIVLDIGLPDLLGLDVLRKLRAGESGNPDVPVIFLTARDAELDRVLGLELGADDYVSKPFSPREISARVRAMLRREQRHKTRAAALADASQPIAAQAEPAVIMPETDAKAAEKPALQHDPDARCIRYHGTLLDLTRYEYQLLAMLLRHPGRIYTRQEIMDRVWADAPDTTDRTVDAHIKTLRAKLRAVHDGDDPIRTWRGMGYGLTAAGG